MTHLPPHTALLLWSLSLTFQSRLEDAVAPLGLTAASFRLVGELMASPEPLRPGELARRLGIRPPSVTAMVRRLEDAGVVVVVPDPADRRAHRVHLAPDAPVHAGLEVLDRLDADLLADLDPAAVRSMLEQLVANLAGSPAETP